MTAQVWIALAHVRPGAENDDPEFEDVAGAYANALVLANDRIEAADRIRDALDELALELIELEDSEPVHVRFRAHAVDADLLELALEAAHTREVQFDVFQLYTADDEPREQREPPPVTLRAALHDGTLVELKRDPVPSERLEGFVVGLADDWALLHVLSPDVVLNGYAAVRVADVIEVETHDASSFAMRALDLRRQEPLPLLEIHLGDVRSILATALEEFPLVTIFVEHDAPDEAYVGKVEAFRWDELEFRHLSTSAEWDDVERYRYDRVTRIDFGGLYEEALALVAAE